MTGPRSAIAQKTGFSVALVSVATGFWVLVGCEMTDRKFVSGGSMAGSSATLSEAGVDPEPDVDSLPLCPRGASCEDSGCTDNGQCTAPTRCDPIAGRCIGCLSNADCSNEGDLCRTSDGACVECLNSDAQCGDPMRPRCDVESGTCVACLDDSQCLAASAARCEVAPTPPNRFACVGCNDDAQCNGKPGLGPTCRARDGVCVGCLTDAECSNDVSASHCAADGQCVPCENDGECALLGGRLNVCLPAAGQNRCVECSENSHCVGSDVGAVCKTSNAGAANGPGAINACVECISNTDCTDPSASRCVQNACVPCAANADCNAVPNLGICDLSGGVNGGSPQCVQCTGLERQSCGANICDTLEKTCRVDALPRSAGMCEQCFSDDHCAANARCVQQVFQGTAIGYFCFPVAAAGTGPCAGLQPFFDVLATATIDGNATICGLRSTTCPALNDYAFTTCENDADCGVANLADGFCETIGNGAQCTVGCMTANDCSGADCVGARCTL